MATLHHADSDWDSSETKCGLNVGWLHMETEEVVTTCEIKEFGSPANLRSDTACKNCVEAIAEEE